MTICLNRNVRMSTKLSTCQFLPPHRTIKAIKTQFVLSLEVASCLHATRMISRMTSFCFFSVERGSSHRHFCCCGDLYQRQANMLDDFSSKPCAKLARSCAVGSRAYFETIYQCFRLFTMSRPQIVTTTVLSFADLWHVEGHVLRRVNVRDATKIVLFLSVSRVSKHWSLSIAKGAETW